MEGPEESILQRGLPSRTALWVAKLRAVHQLLDEPIVLYDPLAMSVLGNEISSQVNRERHRYNDAFNRFLRAKMVARSKLAEDEMLRAMTSGIKQFVILGAGLDTSAYRAALPHEDMRIFEVDHPATQVWKRELLSDAKIEIPAQLVFAPIDFESDTLANGLAKAGFNTEEPACITWLGVMMYLTEEAIMSVLQFVATLPPGSSIVFDYHRPAIDPMEEALAKLGRKQAGSYGEPFRSAFETDLLREKLYGLGFSVVEAWDATSLSKRYFEARRDGLQAWGSVICARR